MIMGNPVRFSFQHRQVPNLIMVLTRSGSLLRPLTPFKLFWKNSLEQNGLLSKVHYLLQSESRVEDKARYQQKLDTWMSIFVEKWKIISTVGIRLSRNIEARKNWYKFQHRWHCTPVKTCKRFPGVFDALWWCIITWANKLHLWWSSKKSTKCWKVINVDILRIIGFSLPFTASVFLLNDG